MMLLVPFEQEDIGLFNFIVEILSLLDQSEETFRQHNSFDFSFLNFLRRLDIQLLLMAIMIK